MIPTEQKRNPGEFGETRTFSVPAHSADTIKKNINTQNAQSLERKNTAGEPGAAYQNRPNHPAQGRPQTNRPVNPVNPAQNTNSPQRMDARPQRSVPQNSQPAPQRVMPQNGQPAPQRAMPQNGQPAPQRAMPQNGQPAQQRAMPPVQRQTAPEERAVVPKNQKTELTAGTSKLESSLMQKAAQIQKAQAAEEKRVQMMKTRKTDITAVKAAEIAQTSAPQTAAQKRAAERKEQDRLQREANDEGGNTVVSVVKAVVYIVFVLVISVFLALAIINIGNDVFSFVKSDEIVEIEIPEFATLDEVADVLFRNDIIKYPAIFKLYAVAKHSDTDFLAGTYSVNGMMNYDTLLDEFKEKPETGTVDITIPEGYTVDEIIDLFVEGYGMGTREGFVEVIENGEFDYWFIRELEENGVDENRIYRLEGYLFPDTYQFYKASSEWSIVNKLLKRFSQIFTKEYRAQCEVFGYTVDEMITLASMIEKEAGAPSEFFTVSSVFHNRLNAPWNFPKLESDATVVYQISHENGERTAVTAADLDRDIPYNTYLYNGLPPGPIANPSASAMLAALSPQTTNYYFFIANRGVTYYSETKEQHEAYIAQFAAGETVQQTTGDMPNQ